VGERDRVLWLAATRLPSPRARHLVWLLAFRPELTQHQMARELGIAVGSVGPLRRRSLDTLRRQLRAHGYRTPDPHCWAGDVFNRTPPTGSQPRREPRRVCRTRNVTGAASLPGCR